MDMPAVDAEISAIFQAAEVGDFHLIIQAIRDYGLKAIGSLRNNRGETLLEIAERNGTLHNMQQLLPQYEWYFLSAEVGLRGSTLPSWWTGYQIGMMETSRFFIQNNGYANESTSESTTMNCWGKPTGLNRRETREIFQAVKDGNSQRISQALDDHGPDIIGSVDVEELTLMGLAVEHDELDIIRLMHQNGVGYDDGDVYTLPAWMLAFEMGRLEISRFMIENGVDVNMIQDNGGQDTPLFSACEDGRLEMARLFLELGADVDKGNTWGSPPLSMACFRGNLELARLLLQNGADVNKADECGETPLFAVGEDPEAARDDSELEEELIRNITRHRWINGCI